MIKFLLNPQFLIPFLSTAGASITVIFLQSIYKIIHEKKKRLYTIAYMIDVCVRILHSNLIIQNNTIEPHIEASKQILVGDQDLLKTMFLADEFDILTDGSMEFNNIPDDYKILLGYDDIELLQSFETILYLNRIDKTRFLFNDFVNKNLKSELQFNEKTQDEQRDILNTYWDYLDRLSHERKRIIASILYIFLPLSQNYTKRAGFFFFNKRNINNLISESHNLKNIYSEIIPKATFFQEIAEGGIQKILKGDIDIELGSERDDKATS